jgi:KDO2-lipid IV(A) lauroyltransferase
MSHKQVKFRHRLEYAGVLLFEWVFRILPYRAGIGLAWLLARFAFHVIRFRRREAVRRIQSVLGVDRRAANRIAWQSIRNLFYNIAEIMGIGALTDAWIARHYPDGNADKAIADLRRRVEEGKGVILALPHLGNWDLAGILTAHAGLPIFSIAGIQHNPLTNDWINRKRATGITILERGSSSMRQVLRRLKAGEILAILPDVRMKTPDLTVQFLGGEANLGRGMAAFARRTGSPIVLAKVRRVGLSHHVFDLAEPLFPDKSLDDEADVRRLTETVMAAIEAQIRADPGQWFWYNKRWVLDPLVV